MKTSESAEAVNKYYIYVHRQKDTGAVFYVGKGSGERLRMFGNRSLFWKRMAAKHGVVPEIAEDGLSELDSLEREKEWIKYYRSIGEARANISDGGDGVLVSKRWWGQKISDGLKRRMKMFPAKRGAAHPNHIAFADAETLKKEYQTSGIVLLARKYGVSRTTVQSRLKEAGVALRTFSQPKKPVLCIEDQTVFQSIREAAAHYGAIGTNISKAIRGKHKSCMGKTFKLLQS